MIEAFIGKGGVGKTSIASAYALLCAEKSRTAIVSTDFMPSLKYIFPEKIRNLDVMEISEGDISKEWIEKYGDQVHSILSELFDADEGIIEHIASSPGVAEEFMISKVVEMDKSGEYDYIIWDTPASSSTMHLLALEKDFYEHLDRDIRFYLLVKDKFRLSKTKKILREWQELANDVWKSLEETMFYLVFTGDELSIIQSEEIRREFEKMGLSVDRNIFNRYREGMGVKGDVSIPELDGNARNIVNRMREYISPLFDMRNMEKA